MATKKVTVFGGGSFGTALAYALAKNGHNVMILSRNPEVNKSINENHKNSSYLTDSLLPSNITATSDPKEALENADYILHSIPIQVSKEYLENLKQYISPDIPIISSSKGLHSAGLVYMSDLVPTVLGRDQPMAFISGPSFAKELMQDYPTAVVVASKITQLCEDVQRLFASETLRVYTTDDVIGVQVGGALKNIFAIAAGIIEGLGLGVNTMAALVTRGCSEMCKLAVALGGRPETLSGLSGIGDLMLSCFGALSRNKSVGRRLGQGETLEQIIPTLTEVAEGVATTTAVVKLADERFPKLELPIIRAVDNVLKGILKPREAVVQLMTLPLTREHDLFSYDK